MPDNDTIQQPVVPPQPEEGHPLVHTYAGDLDKAMNTTDATVVQELLTDAREREATIKDEEIKKHQRGWYISASIILILLAIAAAVYGVYYYKHLTVPVQKTLSVGVFQNTDPVVISKTDIRQTVSIVVALPNLPEGKPLVIPLVADADSLAAITTEQFFQFIESDVSEPFQSAISLARLGIINTGSENTPFLIFSAADPEIASKEFLFAEPDMVHMFYAALNIDLATHTTEIGKKFTSEYSYNLPVRTLRDPAGAVVLYYGYATPNTIVVTTKPLILKAIYDTIIRQQ